ncbi:unnamed protein product [Caenorhabditis auriculariae]|uniref:Tetraspanin n=1 Tax=Caenorhabditis auriculariae TaxID=2777116 RepID=A0A8S1GXS3_9PELO|nr:unnamed protein product [Caenorhabditis auriculariae]
MTETWNLEMDIFQLVALAVIALAIWIRVDNDFESEIRANIKRDTDAEPLSDIKYDMRVAITVVFWVIIGFAIACVLLGLTGFLGAIANSRALMAIYFVCMAILILLEIAIGIYVLVVRKNVRSTVKDYVFYSYAMNSSPDVHAFQFRYNCCGVELQPNTQCMAGQGKSNDFLVLL